VAIHYNSAGSKAETEKTLKTLQAYGVKAIAIQAELGSAASVTK
jgi:hypothetical protein